MKEKLVRDNIPQIIKANGENAVTRKLSAQEYLDALDAKLQEELDEYLANKDLHELADLEEVIRAIVIARGSSPEALEKVRMEKLNERGGFTGRIALSLPPNAATE